MKNKVYPIKGVYSTLYAALIFLSIVLMIFHIYSGSLRFFLHLGLFVLWVFQYKWATKGLIIIEGAEATIKPSVFETYKVNLTLVKKIETPKNKKMILYPKDMEKVTIPLKFLSEENIKKVLAEIPIIVDSKSEEDHNDV